MRLKEEVEKKSMLKRNDRWEYEHGKLISGGKFSQ
jgi:hypothetical protein